MESNYCVTFKKKKNQMSNNLDAPILNILNEWNGH